MIGDGIFNFLNISFLPPNNMLSYVTSVDNDDFPSGPAYR